MCMKKIFHTKAPYHPILGCFSRENKARGAVFLTALRTFRPFFSYRLRAL